MTANSRDPTGLRDRLWRWCCRHPWLAVPGALFGALIALIATVMAYEAWLLHGWRPDIVASAQIVDYDTRQPVAGVWVLIYIHAYARSFDDQGRLIWYIPEGGANGMPSPLSTVVQTDREGRFHYRVRAWDAFQSAGYTKFLLRYGAYKTGYESVNPDTGKSSKGGENYLTLEKPKPGQPWAFVRRVTDSAAGRRASRDDFPVGLRFHVPSELTWPQWRQFYYQVVSDELDHWCLPQPAAQEDRSLLGFVGAAKLLRQQQSILNDWLTYQYRASDPKLDSKLSLRHDLLRGRYQQAAQGFPWPIPHSPTSLPNDADAALTFTAEQKQALCVVLREQSDSIFHESTTSGSSSP